MGDPSIPQTLRVRFTQDDSGSLVILSGAQSAQSKNLYLTHHREGAETLPYEGYAPHMSF